MDLGCLQDTVLRLDLEVSVGDAEAVVAAELEVALSILVHLPNAVVTQTGWPGAVVCANSGVEITKDKHGLWVKHVTDDYGELIVAPDLCF